MNVLKALYYPQSQGPIPSPFCHDTHQSQLRGVARRVLLTSPDIVSPRQPTIHTHSSRPFNVLRAAMKQPMSKVLICPERACAHASLFHCLNEASWASRVTSSLELGSGRAELVALILCEDSGNCERRLQGPCRAIPAQRKVFLPG